MISTMLQQSRLLLNLGQKQASWNENPVMPRNSYHAEFFHCKLFQPLNFALLFILLIGVVLVPIITVSSKW